MSTSKPSIRKKLSSYWDHYLGMLLGLVGCLAGLFMTEIRVAVLVWVVVIMLTWIFKRPALSYDEAYLYVTKFSKTKKYDLRKVRRINGCYGGGDRTFQVEFYPERGSALKINYVPPWRERMHYLAYDELTGRAKAFVDHLREIQPSNSTL